ncbi:hypothetical protein MNBD_GAMMA20-13 [hydrothermal vent metagenome]|uniref:Lipoprotein n=1 Tax=hydrothermal vent metagenome TaxID=652676 RepID=A0A3B1A4Z0_9ZZZZ
MKTCWAQYLFWLIVATLGVGGALSACGQKGALYHPAPEVAPAAQVEDAPEVTTPTHGNTQKSTS